MTKTVKKLIAGNWKLHGNQGFTIDLCEALTRGFNDNQRAEMVICPPFTAVLVAASCLEETSILIGAQDCSAHDKGAFTGEISAEMVAETGASYVIVGHSERRTHHGESDSLIRAKAEQAIKAGLIPIICVGESEAERAEGRAEPVVEKQLAGSLPQDGHVVVAYEPVWAIGTGKVATPDDIAGMHRFIASHLSRAGRSDTLILYGGSVKPDNAAAILSTPHVGGVLVGGASLKADDFLAIYNAA